MKIASIIFRLLVLNALTCAASPAAAQNHICPTASSGDNSDKCASTGFVQQTISGGGNLPLPNAEIYAGNAGGIAAPVSPTGNGDCSFTFTNLGVFGFTCLKTNGVSFGPLATANAGIGLAVAGGNLNLQPSGPSTIGGVQSVNCSPQVIGSISAGVPGCVTVSGGVSGTTTVTGPNTTYTSSQLATLVLRSNSGSPMIDTLPGTSPGVLPAGNYALQNADTAGVLALNVGSGAALAATKAPTGYIYICPGQTFNFHSDGSNYQALSQPPACLLKAATTFYAASSGGSASNHGLTSSAPLDGITHAYSLAASVFNASLLNPSTQAVTIQASDCLSGSITYAGQQIAGRIPGQAEVDGQNAIFPVVIQGNTTTPDNCLLNDTVGIGGMVISGNASALVYGFAISSSGSNGLLAEGAHVAIKAEDFKGATVQQLAATHRGFIEIVGSYAVSGSAQTHIFVSDSSSLYFQTATTITFNNSPIFSVGFAGSQYAATIALNVIPSYVNGGTVSGPRYAISLNGVINTGTSSSCGSGTTFPGSTNGSCSTGGQYN